MVRSTATSLDARFAASTSATAAMGFVPSGRKQPVPVSGARWRGPYWLFPGMGEGRINTAFEGGIEGNGAYRVARTIRNLTGLRINHVMYVDLAGFQNLVDTLGGVDLCIPAYQVNTPGYLTQHTGDGGVTSVYYEEPGRIADPNTGLDVAPGCQREGVGSALIEAGLAACRAAGVGLVVVLGHASYYPRFGFEPAWPFGLYYAAPGPNPSFMVRELERGALRGRSGRVVYHAAFDGL